jgi:hypothetical protein
MEHHPDTFRVSFLVGDIIRGKLKERQPLPNLTCEENEQLRKQLLQEMSWLREFGEKEGGREDNIIADRIRESLDNDNRTLGRGVYSERENIHAGKQDEPAAGMRSATRTTRMDTTTQFTFKDVTGITMVLQLPNLTEEKILEMHKSLSEQIMRRNIEVPEDHPLLFRSPLVEPLPTPESVKIKPTGLTSDDGNSSSPELPVQHSVQPDTYTSIDNPFSSTPPPIPAKIQLNTEMAIKDDALLVIREPLLNDTPPLSPYSTSTDTLQSFPSTDLDPDPLVPNEETQILSPDHATDEDLIEGSDFEFLAFTAFFWTAFILLIVGVLFQNWATNKEYYWDLAEEVEARKDGFMDAGVEISGDCFRKALGYFDLCWDKVGDQAFKALNNAGYV